MRKGIDLGLLFALSLVASVSPVSARGQELPSAGLVAASLAHVRTMMAPGAVAVDTAQFEPSALRATVVGALGVDQTTVASTTLCAPREVPADVPLLLRGCTLEGSGLSAIIWPRGPLRVQADSALVLVNTAEHATTASGWSWIRGRTIAVRLVRRAAEWTVVEAWTMAEAP